MERGAGQQHPFLVAGAEEDLSGGHADSQHDTLGGTARRPFAAQLGGRPDGPQRVVLARDRQAENGGHAILIGAADDAPVTLDRPADDRLGTAPKRLRGPPGRRGRGSPQPCRRGGL